jgi:N-acetyl-1-D-myo-inositol-2-amino-2-deoxy-alpha-D-glucopyranoside deacetylase
MAGDTERVLFVHAHPDDETISTGATIATLVEAGASVTVLTCTRGELGEVIPEELRHLTGAELGAYRLTELAAAIAALGVTDHRILGAGDARWAGRAPREYHDSGMRWGEHGAEAVDTPGALSLVAADPGEVAADIAAVVLDVEPHVIVTYAADGGYGHPDHVRVHEATRTAAEVLHVPLYVVAERGTVSVDPAPVLTRKRAALEAHRTQVAVEGDTFRLSSGEPRPISATESFVRLRPEPPRDGGPVSRVVACVLALALGAFAGATLTVSHQASVQLGPVAFPWGIVVAVILTAALLAGLRIVFDTRVQALCAAAGLVGASALLAIQSIGGSVLVPGNPVGYVWTFAPVLIAVAVLVWPRRVPDSGGNIEVRSAKGPDLP